ncbi:MAG: selenocysteine-specific translation elongation factor, partial [Firmicutes bacterium]|nr:selenocysteine-specific translation elongation factor [Bacillota bacterium]
RQEQERGLTIELGFAPLTLPSGRTAGVVDVPGHERFIKNMLAGATGVDVALLVVAADEGVMPQTDEHLDILNLLGVRHGVVAVTKADMVEAEWLELVEEDVRERLAGTLLSGAAIVPVSAVTGQGLDELLRQLDLALDLAASASVAERWSSTRLPVDRVFAISGHGTVVTGTLIGGSIKPGDRLELLPAGKSVRVRQVQVHDNPVEAAERGQRVALNLAGLERGEIERGMVLAAPGILQPSRLFDAELTLLPSAAPVEHGDCMHLHMGTAEATCRVRVIGGDAAFPGETALVQLELAECEGVAARGDRFIVRTYSPMSTAGGGRILAVARGRVRRFRPEIVREFETLSGGDDAELATLFVHRALREHARPATAADVARAMFREEASVRALLERGVAAGAIVELGGLGSGGAGAGGAGDGDQRGYLTQGDWADVEERMHDVLAGFHAREPLRAGMAREELRNRAFPGWDFKWFTLAMSRAAADGIVREQGALAALPSHRVTLSPEQQEWARRIEDAFASSLMSPPERLDAMAGGAPQAVLDYLIDMGVVMRVGAELLFHRDAIARALGIARELGRDGRAFTAAEFRDSCGNTRKYAVALLEYMDSSRITRRIGDERVLA